MLVRRITAKGPFGILDFGWEEGLPDFDRFNLIYGWNRSGKTTLSRIFSACAKETTTFDHCPSSGTFSVQTDTGATIKSSNLSGCGLSVRVFNEDFVTENVSFSGSQCEPIVYISEEDIADRDKLDELNRQHEPLVTAYEAARKQTAASSRALERFYESTALAVKNSLGKMDVNDQYRTYDKRRVRQFLESKSPKALQVLNEKALLSLRSVCDSDSKDKFDTIPECALQVRIGRDVAAGPDAIRDAVEELTSKSVVADSIERLASDPALNEWVKRGFDLQTEAEQTKNCPYCEQALQPDFLGTLSRHFSDDYKRLQEDCRSARVALESLHVPRGQEGLDVYPGLADEYSERVKEFIALADELSDWIDVCVGSIQQKIDAPLKNPQQLSPLRPAALLEYESARLALNSVITSHNDQAKHHATEAQKAKDAIAEHLIGVAASEQDLEGMLKSAKEDSEAAQLAETALRENTDAVAALHRKSSNVGGALVKINEYLDEFFGLKEIQLESDGKGYRIRRCGEIADSLSEGEKTAIAFSYFVAKVQERNFRVSEGIVVIDDPISSLDSNFIFHSFGLIKRHFDKAGQLFVLTHNFELFNLTKDWFNRKNVRLRQKGRPTCCEFYTVENKIENGARRGYLSPMDDTLRNFHSEYQYLFVRLSAIVGGSATGYGDLYTVGNIARRFLEIFAGFKVPTTSDLFGKVEQLKTTTVSGAQKEKIYRLVQEYSHAEDPTCAVAHKDKSEVVEAVSALLKLVEESDPEHFLFLSRNVPSAT